MTAILRPGIMIGAMLAITQAASAAQAQQIAFDIPAQSTADALNAWSRQSGIQILFPFDAVANRTAVEVRERMTPQAALRRLIARQPLMIANETATTVALRAAPSTVQVTDTEESTQANSSGDIVVTAQRRRERQQDVPIALTAFDRDTIRKNRIQTLRDVSRQTPGLVVSTFSLSSPVIAVRGATNTFNQIGANKPVAIVVDDVYIARNSAATLELFGIDSIQVLKGPQGTLFGRNVTGGAIVIDTGRPNFDATRFDANLAVGSFKTVDVDALADVPLSEESSLRLAGTVRRHDGWGRDRLTGQELDDQQSTGLRGQFRAKLADALEMRIGADYATDESGGRTLSSIGVGNDGDRRTAEGGLPQRFEREQGGISGRLFFETGVGELTSITAWRRSRTTDIFANVGANFRFLTGTRSQAATDDRDRITTFSQEVRFASETWDRGSFIVGAYFASEDSKRLLTNTARAAVTGNFVTRQLADQAVLSKTYAVFADGTLNVMPWLGVTFGGRYTWDEKRASLTRTDFIRPVNNFTANDLSSDWSRFTPRAIVKVTPTRDLMLYASYARGYTSGGYNTEAATVAALTQPFAPETLDNYELGVKSELLDRRLRVNVSAFTMKYRDKQELFFNNLTRVLNIVNASRATMKGVEAEVQLRPVAWFGITGTYGYLDTRYDDFVIPGGAVNTGNRLGSSPEHKVSVAADLDVPTGPIRFVANAAYSYTSGYFTGASADPGLFVPGYALVNGSLGIAGADDRWRINAFVRNLLDTEYLLIPSVQVVRAEYLGEPRIVGVSAGVRF